MPSLPLSYIELSAAGLRHNIAQFRKVLGPKVQIAFPVKANAYGHGLEEIIAITDSLVDYFQIDDIEELRRVRMISNTKTLVLGYIPDAQIAEAIRLQGILGVFSIPQLQHIETVAATLGSVVPIHVKLDAGLGREGLLAADVEVFINCLKKSPHVRLEGVYAHFANIEDTSDFSYSQQQIESFEKSWHHWMAAGFGTVTRHLSASSAMMVYENTAHNTLVRPGIATYGLWPSSDIERRFSGQFSLQPVLRWVSHIAEIKELPAGHPIGYGLTYYTTRVTKIALIPQGYSDGFDRGFSNTGRVLIHGEFCPVLGRIAMNMFVVDVTNINNVCVEDEVVLLGHQGKKRITAEDMASQLGTINYEIIARLSPLLPRIVV